MSAPAPDAGLSDAESRIMTSVLSQLTGPIHHIVQQSFAHLSQKFQDELLERIDFHLEKSVERAVERALRNDPKGSVGSYNSRDSLTSASFSSSSSGTPEAGFRWTCPLCDSTLKDEHSFDEHLKKALNKLSMTTYQPVIRKSRECKRPHCVFDVNDHQHRLLMSPWRAVYPDDDQACGRAFVRHLRNLLTPGARAVFADGTGNITRVVQFIHACQSGVPFAVINSSQ